MPEQDPVWNAISAVEKGQAAMHQAVETLTRSVDGLVVDLREHMRREEANHTEQVQRMATVEQKLIELDVKANKAHQRIDAHKKDHRWFAGQLLTAATVLIALIELASKFWK